MSSRKCQLGEEGVVERLETDPRHLRVNGLTDDSDVQPRPLEKCRSYWAEDRQQRPKRRSKRRAFAHLVD